jgi:RNA polymerase sigma-70 factor (ECF subfamily)
MVSTSPEESTVNRGEEGKPDDHELVRETLAGRTEAFRTLVERYSGLVYNVAYGMLHNAEESRDAVQEVFYRAFRGLAGFRSQYPFGVWLRRIAVNYMLDLRKKRRLPTVFMDDLGNEGQSPVEFPDEGRSALESLLEQEQEERVRETVANLPPKYRIVIVLRHFEDMSYEEIAKTLGCPLGTVMTRLHRARQRLADLLIPSLETNDEPVVQT